MIGLVANDERYDYDIRTLLQAFFDNEKIVADTVDVRMLLQITFHERGEHCVLFTSPEGKVYERHFSGEYKDKMQLRNVVKDAVYDILCEYTGHTLPWGTLTGIRPVKIITGLLEEGMSPEDAKQHFLRVYRTTEQKADISLRVAKREQEVLQDIAYENQYSLYIGIPFCPSRCLYCSFTSFPIELYETMVEDYLAALFLEIDFASQAMRDRQLISIYVGGGTPTSLSASQLERLLKKIEDSFAIDYVREFTVEAGRPDSITLEKLKVLYHSPVTRISINPQTMNDKTLKLIGRAHTVEQVKHAYALAREVGFDNINMDLIMGLPGETQKEVFHTLSEITRLRPDNLTIHSLAMKRASNLNIMKEQYEGVLYGTTDAMLNQADETARELFMQPYYLYRQKNIPGNYENIGYSIPGKEGIYNILIMEEKQTILALGAGASSKYVYSKENRIERTENVKDVKLYIERIDEMIERKRSML